MIPEAQVELFDDIRRKCVGPKTALVSAQKIHSISYPHHKTTASSSDHLMRNAACSAVFLRVSLCIDKDHDITFERASILASCGVISFVSKHSQSVEGLRKNAPPHF